jgi:prepilin-type N-terminal cleavage/methylation domain-containing protein
MSNSKSETSPGFTLIEIILVLTILTILTAAVVPLYQGSITWARGDRAVRDFVSLMKYGQERAVTDVTEYRLYMDEDEGRYWLMRLAAMDGDEKTFEEIPDAVGGIRTLPEGTTLVPEEARRDAKRNAHFIAFHSSGACDYASVSLERNDREATRIETKGKLGQFEVTER